MSVLKKVFFNKLSIVIVSLCVFEYGLALFLAKNNFTDTPWNNFYNVVIAIIPALGGFIAVKRMGEWGGFSSRIGKAVMFIGMGQFCWSLGAIVWVYYFVFEHNVVPYPSVADIFYSALYPFWGVGVIMFGIMIALRDESKLRERILSICVPVFMAVVSYYLTFVDLHGNNFWNSDQPFKVFLDVFYPMSDIAILTALIIICGTKFNYLGLRLKIPFTILVVALSINYVADFIFSYTTTAGTFYSGSLSDVFYATSLTLLSLSLNRLTPSLLEDKNNEAK